MCANKKKAALLPIVWLLLACLLFSCGGKDAAYTVNGLTITLPDRFVKSDCAGYTACYESDMAAIFMLEEFMTAQNGLANITLMEYATMVRDANAAKDPGEISTDDGVISFEYTFRNEQEGQDYSYYTAVFQGTESFWLVQFATFSDEYESRKPDFVKWAKTVVVA